MYLTRHIARLSLILSIAVILASCGSGSRDNAEKTEEGKIEKSYPGKLSFKIFLESSGSMWPYDSADTEGDFKSAVSTLINEIPGNATDSTTLFIVNRTVTRYDGTFKDFIKADNIYSNAKEIGDYQFTDFTCIFDSLLNNTGKGEVSVLVSDLIYSTEKMSFTNPQKILSEARNMVTSVFNSDDKDKDLIVVKMSAGFSGNYYPYNTPNQGIKYSGPRPYYFVIVAPRNVMRRIYTDTAFSTFRDFSKLAGYENFYCFSSPGGQPYWSFILSGEGKEGSYAKDNSGTAIHNLKGLKTASSGKLSLLMAVDLSSVICDDKYKLDPSSYKITSAIAMKVAGVREINRTLLSEVQKKYVGDATHFIVIDVDTQKPVTAAEATLSMINRLPDWIYQTGSEDDTNISSSNFGNTTFGFTQIMEGIRDSYFGKDEQPDYFTLKFNLKP